MNFACPFQFFSCGFQKAQSHTWSLQYLSIGQCCSNQCICTTMEQAVWPGSEPLIHGDVLKSCCSQKSYSQWDKLCNPFNSASVVVPSCESPRSTCLLDHEKMLQEKRLMVHLIWEILGWKKKKKVKFFSLQDFTELSRYKITLWVFMTGTLQSAFPILNWSQNMTRK